MTEQTFVAGQVAFIGKPNVGKSTLLNALLGEQVRIVTPKPQTTRHRIVGILNQPQAQIVFLDTPGFHASPKLLNQTMNKVVENVFDEVDALCLLIEPSAYRDAANRKLFQLAGADRCLVVINKCDLIEASMLEKIAQYLHKDWGAKEIIAISALHKIGFGDLLETLKKRLSHTTPLYPEDSYTTHSLRFLAAEIIREEVFLQMHEEIPYASAVLIEEFSEVEDRKNLTRIAATLVVEKESQKPMLIGKGGEKLKEIGQKARLKLEELIGTKVFLKLFVKVEPGWTKDREKIRKLGYEQE